MGIPFMEDQARARHQVEMGVDNAVETRRRHRQFDGKPRSYCGQSPCTTKENGRALHCWSGVRPGERSADAAQKDGDQDSAST